jgi:hypothetical protein
MEKSKNPSNAMLWRFWKQVTQKQNELIETYELQMIQKNNYKNWE